MWLSELRLNFRAERLNWTGKSFTLYSGKKGTSVGEKLKFPVRPNKSIGMEERNEFRCGYDYEMKQDGDDDFMSIMDQIIKNYLP